MVERLTWQVFVLHLVQHFIAIFHTKVPLDLHSHSRRVSVKVEELRIDGGVGTAPTTDLELLADLVKITVNVFGHFVVERQQGLPENGYRST